jgi:iron(III) transport system ATP-binding protein
MIVVENVSLNYERTILDRISFEVKSGETLGIVGKSGAGKSSLLKIIAGLLDVTSGQVSCNDERVKGPSERLVPGHPEIQLVNQDFKLETFHTVEENIRECILYLPTNVRDRFVDELIGLLELNDVRTQKAHTLSGGEQQRLSIARALAREPKVLLLDEPFSHLDGRLRLKLITYLIELKQVRGTTIILVSHDGSDVLSLSNRIVLMKNGMIQRGGVPRKMYYGYRTL